MATSNFNMEDPSKQEAIRRGPHKYIPTAGKHGSYVPEPYKHQEYPKMVCKDPRPEYKDFTKVNGVSIPGDVAQANFQTATAEWDRKMTSSIVNSKAEEAEWLKKNG